MLLPALHRPATRPSPCPALRRRKDLDGLPRAAARRSPICERRGRGRRMTLRRTPNSTIQTLSASDDTPDIDLWTKQPVSRRIDTFPLSAIAPLLVAVSLNVVTHNAMISNPSFSSSSGRRSLRVWGKSRLHDGTRYVDIRHNMRATQGSRAGDAGAAGRKSKAGIAVSRRRDERVGEEDEEEPKGFETKG